LWPTIWVGSKVTLSGGGGPADLRARGKRGLLVPGVAPGTRDRPGQSNSLKVVGMGRIGGRARRAEALGGAQKHSGARKVR
jgi:hypothetical protein